MIFKKAGTVTITAASADWGKVSASVKLKLLPAAESVVITDADGKTVTGKTVKIRTKTCMLSASVEPAKAFQEIKWKSSDTDIAVVLQTGKVVFRKAGTVTISATSKDWGNKTGTVKLKYVP